VHVVLPPHHARTEAGLREMSDPGAHLGDFKELDAERSTSKVYESNRVQVLKPHLGTNLASSMPAGQGSGDDMSERS